VWFVLEALGDGRYDLTMRLEDFFRTFERDPPSPPWNLCYDALNDDGGDDGGRA
jgi:hypothetical protein